MTLYIPYIFWPRDSVCFEQKRLLMENLLFLKYLQFMNNLSHPLPHQHRGSPEPLAVADLFEAPTSLPDSLSIWHKLFFRF